MPRLGAMILTGGASSRMGEDKGAAQWAGRRAVDRVADLAGAIGAKVTITAGLQDFGLPHAEDATRHGGPVGGVLAGATALAERGCDRALVLAVDAPTVRAADLTPLLQSGSPGAAFAGFPLPFVIDLAALPADAEIGWPLMRLIERARLALLKAPPAAGARLRGANTPAEREALLAELVAGEPTRR
jgi:molybdopterin-guanine dinucleotide biosynthesis protein A